MPNNDLTDLSSNPCCYWCDINIKPEVIKLYFSNLRKHIKDLIILRAVSLLKTGEFLNYLLAVSVFSLEDFINFIFFLMTAVRESRCKYFRLLLHS